MAGYGTSKVAPPTEKGRAPTMTTRAGSPSNLPKHLAGVKPPPVAARVPIRLADAGNAAAAGTPLDEIMDRLALYRDDPYGFVMWAFPWGEPGTVLEKQTGPEDWQREQLQRIGQRLREGGEAGAVIEEDVSSGHGVGKSAEVSWLILWAVSTFEDTRGVVTANTDSQLKTKTWAELAKWYQIFIAKQLFTLTATAIYIANDKVREKAWRIDQIPWSDDRTESFAGMHNQGKRILVIFDEASAISDKIWDVTEGALTDADTQILWLRYGNPTRTSGKFFEKCTRPGWISEPGKEIQQGHTNRRNTYMRVDSRTVRFSNKGQIQSWVDEYGLDSDFVRVRVLGLFPHAGTANFISPGLVFEARRRRIHPDMFRAYPKILAIDPARFGDDFSVITLRQGLKVHFQVCLSGFDGFDLLSRVAEIMRQEPGIACVPYDANGNGAELDGCLRRMPGLRIPLMPVMWGCPAKDDKQYYNQRSECWGKMREFLENGQIPDDDDLANQITSLDYGYDGRFRIQLQSKKDIKKNGGKSPDKADSLALSFVPDLVTQVNRRPAKVIPTKRRTVVWSRTG